MNRFNWRHENSCLLLLLLCALVMQSCAAKFTITSQIPGKVLSKNSIGFRETSNTISLKEVDPYTVSVTRNLCKTELLSIEYQALTETKYGTQSFDCSDAYAAYIGQNITALGVPFLYDSVTGFDILKEKCRKDPPVYQIVTTESNDIIKEESYDSKTTVCEELPVKDALLTAKINDADISIATSVDGIASLPPQKVAQLDRAAVNTSITYKYEAIELTTRHLRKKPEFPLLFSTAAMNSPLGDNVTNQWNGSPPTEISGLEMAPEKSFVEAQAPPVTAPLSPPTVVQGDITSVPVANKADNGEKLTAKVDREGAGGISSPVALPPQTTGPEPLKEKLADDIKASPAPGKIAAAEAPAIAKVDRAGVGAVNSPAPAALLPQAAGPEPLKAKWVGGIKIASPPQKGAEAETAALAQSSRDSAADTRSLRIISEDESSPKANKPSRDEIKSAAPASAVQKTHSQAVARSATKTQSSSRAENLLQRILIMSPELHKICCPLTEKLFWNVGYWPY